MDTRPIGVFDSGLGGLTAVRELTKILPHEDIVYFGDTGRVPYGSRGSETIRRYVKQDVNFLMSQNVKMIIAARGTASANMTKEIIDSMGGVPYTGVVVPAAMKAAEVTRTGQIGVIGTRATIRSKAFDNVLHSVRGGGECEVTSNACPLFVSLVENGYSGYENAVTRLVAQDYLRPFIQNPDLDTLILGCTHFPILADIIADILGKRITLVDPGKEAAHYARRILETGDKRNDSSHTGVCRYCISDNPEGFAENAEMILHEPVHGSVEKVDIDCY